MRAKEIFEAALAVTGLTQAEVAKMAGVPEQSLGQKMNVRESIRANEFLELLDVMGIDSLFYTRKDGKVLMKTPKRGKRVTGMADGVIYDTRDSKLLASSFFADGEHEFGKDGKAQELYADPSGRYFLAEYSAENTDKTKIRAASVNVADAFLNMYGACGETETPV